MHWFRCLRPMHIINIIVHFVPLTMNPYCKKMDPKHNLIFFNQIEAPVENNAQGGGRTASWWWNSRQWSIWSRGRHHSNQWSWWSLKLQRVAMKWLFNWNTLWCTGNNWKNNPSLKKENASNLKNWTPVHFFNKLFPWTVIVSNEILGTNASLKVTGVNKVTTIEEMRVYFGI